MKIVINACYGGFRLSDDAINAINNDMSVEPKHRFANDLSLSEIEQRSNPALVNVVERMGSNANGDTAALRIVTIPDDAIDPYIVVYDGVEYIAEGRTWHAEGVCAHCGEIEEVCDC